MGRGLPPLGRRALAEIIQGRMAEAVDHCLNGLDGMAMRDRRNTRSFHRLMAELPGIEFSLPRTKPSFPSAVLKPYAWRAPEIQCAILDGLVLGISTRKAGEASLAMPGRKIWL